MGEKKNFKRHAATAIDGDDDCDDYMRRRSLINRVNSHGVAYIILYAVRTRFVIIFDDEVYYSAVYRYPPPRCEWHSDKPRTR